MTGFDFDQGPLDICNDCKFTTGINSAENTIR